MPHSFCRTSHQSSSTGLRIRFFFYGKIWNIRKCSTLYHRFRTRDPLLVVFRQALIVAVVVSCPVFRIRHFVGARYACSDPSSSCNNLSSTNHDDRPSTRRFYHHHIYHLSWDAIFRREQHVLGHVKSSGRQPPTPACCYNLLGPQIQLGQPVLYQKGLGLDILSVLCYMAH